MDTDKYKAAAKRVNATKPSENFMVVQLSYGTKLVLSHKAGLALIAALENAELFKESYSDKCKIIPIERDAISTQFMSLQEYQQIKIANILNVPLGDIQNIQLLE
mgnify:CR=1 FL=1